MLPHMGQAQHQVSRSLPHHRFRFEAAHPASAEDCSYSRITVFNRQSGAEVQRIELDPESALSLICDLPASMLLQSTDADNDNRKDAFVLSYSAATNQIYDLWLFRPGIGQFRRALANLSNPSVNKARREITSTHQNGLGSSEKDLYRYRGDSFYLYENTVRERNPDTRITQVVVKRLVGGQLRVVRRFAVPDP